jgi:hypothetical protein
MSSFGLGLASIGAATLHPEIERTLCYLCGMAVGVAISLPFVWKTEKNHE